MLVPVEAPPHIAALLLLAERDAGRAVAAAELVYQDSDTADPIGRAWARYALGWALLRRMELIRAQRLLREAQITFEQLCHIRLALHCRRAILIAMTLAGADVGIQEQWDALARGYEAEQVPVEAARTRIQQAAHLNALGRYTQARLVLNQVQTILYTRGTLDDLARLCRVSAITSSYLDEYDDALNDLDTAATYFARLDYQLDVAKCSLERGTLLMRQEQYTAALTELERAHTLFSQLDDQLQLAVCEKTLGLAQSRVGRFDHAIALTVAAQRRFRTLGRHDHVAACDLNLGNIAYYSGRFELAIALYCRAQHVFDRLGIQHDSLIARRNQAMIMRAQGQPAMALDHLLVLEQIVAVQGNVVELANIYQVQADALTDLGQYGAALDRLGRAQTVFAQIGKPLLDAQCVLEQGWLSALQGQFDQAVVCFIAAQPALTQRPIHLWRVFYGLGHCAAATGDAATALAHYARASTLIADLRSALYSEHTSSGLFQQAHQFFCAAIWLAAAQHDVHALLTFVEQQHALLLHHPAPSMSTRHIPADLELTYQHQRTILRKLVTDQATPQQLDDALNGYLDLLLRIRHHTPLPERIRPQPIDLARLRARLASAYPDGWTALVYIECNEQLLIVTIDEQNVALTMTPLDQTLERLLVAACSPEYRRFTYLDLPHRLQSSREPWQGLRMLAERVLPEPVRGLLSRDRRLLIAPSGLLHALPWAALRVADSWLCMSATLHIIPTLGLWEMLSQRPTAGTEALLIGCSAFGDRAEPLPGVLSELDMVAARIPTPVTRLYNQTATRSQVQALNREQRLARYRLIHLATHAQVVAARGLLAHIKLWDDEIFYDEIVGLRLDGAIVVLSTCEGDLGEVLSGEEVLSLGRAFLAAGARDVIASLWTIDDQLVGHFIRSFYDGLATGLDTPAAVAHAQRQMLRQSPSTNDSEHLASPLTWGGFHALAAGTTLHR